MKLLVMAAAVTCMIGCASVELHPLSHSSAAAPSTAAEPTDLPPLPGKTSSPSGRGDGRSVLARNRTTTSGALLLEESSTELSAALTRYAEEPTVESMIMLAQAYMHLGVLDKAAEYLTTASRLDPREGAAWDGLARVWRDGGFPQIGLGDAHRARFASPNSSIVHNTLGTILQALGKGAHARTEFERAAALDPLAAHAFNNLCYSWLKEANYEAAIAKCRQALDIDPTLRAAWSNLDLAHAMTLQKSGAEVSGDTKPVHEQAARRSRKDGNRERR